MSSQDKQYTISRTISSDMVVQRNQSFNVFGWSENKGGIMYGEFMGEKCSAAVEESGEWCIKFSPHEAVYEEQTLKIYDESHNVSEFYGILIGDVWIISGQSNAELNMHFALLKTPEYIKEIKETDNIRIFEQNREFVMSIKETTDLTKAQKDVVDKEGKWRKTVEEAVRPFSALGYYFAKELSKTVDVPLGIVMAAAGGATLAELMPAKALERSGYNWAPAVPAGGFYNALLHPFTKNSITGMVFYQGESESGGDGYKNYAEFLEITVEEYRNIWGLNFPFINVQLSTHMGDSLTMWNSLPNLRASQYTAYQNIANSYLVVSRDQGFREGDPDWAHPYYKLEIGKRAAHIASSIIYGKTDIEYSASPEPVKAIWEKDCVLIDFKYVGDGLKLLTGDVLTGFTAYSEAGDASEVSAEIIDTATVKITLAAGTGKIGYCMFPEGTIEKANLGSSTDYPAPAFEISK